ncbi:hypothetical protein BpHYR1_034967 [Brachionus plicatilis]|uniref:Uncharacterized protein n=1 Tax=Brachionus plicatilis TaxID=10195 RepID=A0A3M7S405_BRAPC|nr:hypothetical protein BpHYR1_034967 [Brachionus plicatilis]
MKMKPFLIELILKYYTGLCRLYVDLICRILKSKFKDAKILFHFNKAYRHLDPEEGLSIIRSYSENSLKLQNTSIYKLKIESTFAPYFTLPFYKMTFFQQKKNI